MNWVDAAVIGLLCFGIVKGAQRGLVRAMATPVGIFLGLVLAYVFREPTAALLADWIPGDTVRDIISFVVIFLAVFLAVELAGAFLNQAVSFLVLPWIDKLGGATGGLLSSSLLVGIASGIISRLAFAYPKPLVTAIDQSKTLELVNHLTGFAPSFLP